MKIKLLSFGCVFEAGKELVKVGVKGFFIMPLGRILYASCRLLR